MISLLAEAASILFLLVACVFIECEVCDAFQHHQKAFVIVDSLKITAVRIPGTYPYDSRSCRCHTAPLLDENAKISNIRARTALTRRSAFSLQEQEQQQQPKEICLGPAILIPTCQTKHVSGWKHLFAPRPWDLSNYGIDHSIRWKLKDSCETVSNRLLEQLGIQSESDCTKLGADMTNSLQAFTDFCRNNLRIDDHNVSFKARIVSSRGSYSAKCPLWHTDNVPVRWIQALAGPGVMWASHDAVNWNHITTWRQQEGGNNLQNIDDVNTREKEDDYDINGSNRVDAKNGVIYKAKEGEAILLRGNLWNELCRYPSDCQHLPVVHKSPHGILPWEGRVLLTIDVDIN